MHRPRKMAAWRVATLIGLAFVLMLGGCAATNTTLNAIPLAEATGCGWLKVKTTVDRPEVFGESLYLCCPTSGTLKSPDPVCHKAKGIDTAKSITSPTKPDREGFGDI